MYLGKSQKRLHMAIDLCPGGQGICTRRCSLGGTSGGILGAWCAREDGMVMGSGGSPLARTLDMGLFHGRGGFIL